MPATRLAMPIPARIDLILSFSMTNLLLEIRMVVIPPVVLIIAIITALSNSK
jgi:hypothetical protein